MKGLILCAGKGTRLYPITLSYPKTLLPVANVPLLQNCIDKLAELEITEIGIVIHPSQQPMIEEVLGSGSLMGINLQYIYQHEPKGISDAVHKAQPFIGGDAFVLLLGDNLIRQPLSVLKESLMVHGHDASLLLAEVTSPGDFGIAEVQNGRIVGLEEKPAQPKSNLAVVGAYAFKSSIFEAVTSIAPSRRGELEITDAIQWLIDQRYSVAYDLCRKGSIDVGTFGRWLEANRWLLDEQSEPVTIHETAVVQNCRFIPPVTVGHGCFLKDSIIGPYVSVSSGAMIEQCHLENSIVLHQARLQHLPGTIRNQFIGFKAALAGIPTERSATKGDKM
ncbi:sugar phosphate nucleotidyltransferase [Paenibacillus gansuensis]|uniref:Glucose-1-phosphate thymidylyltransferase n=1 Tax=Paenibacillus gansuensis TaxID=306542 RepID=A0ABW5PBM8_9BACL